MSENEKIPPFEPVQRFVPLLAWLVVALTAIAIPFKIISYGYLPGDDALRHAAKAVSGKPWQDILVVGDSFKIDHNFGWHFLLRQIYLLTHCSTETLVLVAVVGLFTFIGWSALPWLRRPEAWLIALAAAALSSDMPSRFSLGRPFLLTATGLITILFWWQSSGANKPKWWVAIWFALLIAICSFVHGVWYLWTLPIAAFFLAGQFRWGVLLIIGWLAGVFLGASLTGHPFESLYQAVVMAQKAFALHATERTLVSEFQPSPGDLFGVLILGGLVIMRQLAKLDLPPLAKNPAFWLAVISWILSFKAARFVEDWGWPALMVLAAGDLQALLESKLAIDSFKRLALVCGIAGTTFLIFTNDINSRWTQSLTWTYLTPDNKDLAGWMPDKGGIIYSADMTVFYQTFFKNPHGDWKYILGYEPAFMPAEDFKVYHSILWNYGDAKAYVPWLKKMTPADRLVIRGGAGATPTSRCLEWNYGVSGIWIGRLPRSDTNGAPPTIRATETRDHLDDGKN